MKKRRVWNRILGFREGDRVRIVGVSQYLHKKGSYFLGKTGVIIRVLYKGKLIVVKLDEKKEGIDQAFIASPEDLEYV